MAYRMADTRVSWDDAWMELRDFENRNEDFYFDLHELEMGPSGETILTPSHEFAMEDWFQIQLGQKVVPYGGGNFARRGAPTDLKVEIFNRMISEGANSTVLVRTNDGAARALLSDRYVPYDNLKFFETVHDATRKYNGELQTFSHSPTTMIGRVVFPGFRLEEHGGLDTGILFANSEVGSKAVTLKALVYRLICTNGLVATHASQVFRRAHINTQEMPELVAEAVDEMQETSIMLRDAFVKTSRDFFAKEHNPGTVIRELREANNFIGEGLAINWVLQSVQSARFSVFDLVNGLTSTAQSVTGEERLALEEEASRMVNWTDERLYRNLFKRVLEPSVYAERVR